MTDPNVQRKIVELLNPKPDEQILEIGPGLGALTEQILARGGWVVAVEKDRRFCEILEGELGADYKGRLRIVNGDILETDIVSLQALLSSSVAKQSRSKIASLIPFARNDVKVVSNLPYYITSPILFWLIENRALVEKAVLTMQREVADRILAQPGDKDYGRLTFAMRYYAEVHRAFNVSRNCFTPKPEVDSSVLTLDFHPPSRLLKKMDEDFLFHVVKTAFGARRKTLLNRLANDAAIGKSRNELAEVLHGLGIPEKARAEDLLLKDFINLALSMRKTQ